MSNVLVQPAGRHAPYDQLLEADTTDLLAQIAPLQEYEHITILQDIAQLVDQLAQTVQEQTEGLCCDVYRNLVQELSAYIKFIAWVLSIDHEFMSTEFYPNLTTFTSKAQDTVIVMQAKLSSGVLPQMDTHNENQLNDYLGELRQSFVALDIIKVLDAARLFALELSPLSFKFLCTYSQISNVMMNQIQEVVDSIKEPNRGCDRSKLCHMLRDISKQSGILPSSLFIHGVSRTDNDPVNGGSHADIYRGQYQGQAVALKRLRVTLQESSIQVYHKLFHREVLAWRQLHHEHVLPLLGVDCDTFTHYACMALPWMEYGDVLNCSSILRARGAPVPRERWMRELANGLAYLHAEELSHGDLRAANILVDSDLSVKITDFGMVSFAASLGSRPHGSARWTSPELLKGTIRCADQPSDVYAYGCVCVELYSQAPPFAHIEHEYRVIFAVLAGERPQRPCETAEASQRVLPGVRGLVPGQDVSNLLDTGDSTVGCVMPDSIWTLVQMCLRESPGQRPKAKDVRHQLDVWKISPNTSIVIDCIPPIIVDEPRDNSPRIPERFELELEEDRLPTSIDKSGKRARNRMWRLLICSVLTVTALVAAILVFYYPASIAIRITLVVVLGMLATITTLFLFLDYGMPKKESSQQLPWKSLKYKLRLKAVQFILILYEVKRRAYWWLYPRVPSETVATI